MYSHDSSDSLSMHRRMDAEQKEKKLQRKKKNAPGDITVSHPEDEAEKEADQIARKAMDGEGTGRGDTPVKRKSSSVYAKHAGAAEEPDQEFAQKLSSSKGGGEHLDKNTQEEMESRMGGDFSKVKIHRSKESNEMSRKINARAFTDGSEIHFGEGEYNPGSTEGKELLAHELAHTQQHEEGKLNRKLHRANGEPDTDPAADAADSRFEALKQVAVQYKYALDIFNENIETPTKEELNRDFMISIIKALSGPVGKVFAALFPSASSGSGGTSTGAGIGDWVGAGLEILGAGLARLGENKKLTFREFYQLFVELWALVQADLIRERSKEITLAREKYASLYQVDPSSANAYVQSIEAETAAIVEDLISGNNSVNNMLTDYSRMWLSFNFRDNKIGKPRSGYIKVKINKDWEVKKAWVTGPFAPRIADTYERAYGDSIPLQELGVPMLIKYHSKSGIYCEAWVKNPTADHLYAEVDDGGIGPKKDIQELKEGYTLLGIPSVEKFNFKVTD